mgnify:CR=1 FL=1
MPDYTAFSKVFNAMQGGAKTSGGSLPPIPSPPPEVPKPQASWLPQYDERVPEKMMFHGSNSDSNSNLVRIKNQNV